jgi:hypothetical protein
MEYTPEELQQQKQNAQNYLEIAKAQYPDHDPAVVSLLTDMQALSVIQKRGGMNAIIYLPIFDQTLKELRSKDRYTDLATILLATVTRITDRLNNPKHPRGQTQEEITLGYVLTTLHKIAEAIKEQPEARDKIY